MGKLVPIKYLEKANVNKKIKQKLYNLVSSQSARALKTQDHECPAYLSFAGYLSLTRESGPHNTMRNCVSGRISDEKDKSAVYAGI